MNSKIYSKFLFHHHLSSSSVVISISMLTLTTSQKFSGILDNFPSHTAHQLSNSRWWSYLWSSHHTIQLFCYHTPFSPWILPVWSQIFHIQIFPAHPPFNRTNNHPIPLLQYHWCWQFQKRHPRFPSLHKPSFQCIQPRRSIFLYPQIHSRHPCPNQNQNSCPKTPHTMD